MRWSIRYAYDTQPVSLEIRGAIGRDDLGVAVADDAGLPVLNLVAYRAAARWCRFG